MLSSARNHPASMGSFPIFGWSERYSSSSAGRRSVFSSHSC
ncbi:hypothetical protein ACFSQ7_13520 [Paenibacillus rhizoplanae]